MVEVGFDAKNSSELLTTALLPPPPDLRTFNAFFFICITFDQFEGTR